MLGLAAVLSGGACDGRGESASQALLELERLSFVPAAERRLEGYSGPFADCSLPRPLLVDRYEVTRGEWLLVAPDDFAPDVLAKWTNSEGTIPEETLDWPATWVTLDEARAFAALRHMRLPTPREWTFVAIGYSRLAYPWGRGAQSSFSNVLELGLGRLAAAGTFESGQAPTYGVYDLLGNAMEWVDGWVPGYGDYHPEQGLTHAGEASAMGGSFRDALRPTYAPWIRDEWLAFQATTLDPHHRSDDLGLRCVANASEYLWARAGDWGDGEGARRRVAAVARSWSAAVGPREVARVVEELAQRPDAPASLGWLLEGTR